MFLRKNNRICIRLCPKRAESFFIIDNYGKRLIFSAKQRIKGKGRSAVALNREGSPENRQKMITDRGKKNETAIYRHSCRRGDSGDFL